MDTPTAMTQKTDVPFDKVLFNLKRLFIVQEIFERGSVVWRDLRDALLFSNGSMAKHLRILEEHDIIEFKKEFIGRRPCTTYWLTRKGQATFWKLKAWFSYTFIEEPKEVNQK